MKSKKVRTPAEIGSKQWYHSMRALHMALWLAPLLPLIYGKRRADWDASIQIILVMMTPWVLTAVVLAMLSHALWRIEVNVAGNSSRPFTSKDSQTFRRATAASVGIATFLTLFMLTLDGWGMTRQQKETVFDASSATALVLIVVVLVATTMLAIHRKGMQTHESLTKAQVELEKGV